jgi:phospholysine phosphohistidine inorganic pyrophosphate phosphatase
MSTQGDLYCLGKGKFYREDGELTLDVGPFAAALEFATDRKAIVVGKPGDNFINILKVAFASVGLC